MAAPRSALLVVKPDAIGDQVLFGHALASLLASIPHDSVTVVTQDRSADFYEAFPGVDRVVGVDRGRFWRDPAYAAGLILGIRKRRFSVAIHAMVSRDVLGALLCVASGAPRVVGLAGDRGNIPARLRDILDRRYSELVADSEESPFEGYKYLDLARHFGGNLRREDWRPLAFVGAERSREAAALMAELGLQRGRFAVVVPGAGEPVKCWPPGEFARVADRIVTEKGLAVVLAGSPGEKELAGVVSRSMMEPSVLAAGRTSVMGLAALLREAALLVGNDSGPVHLAAAVGTPAVCVLSGAHYGRFLPYPEPFPVRIVTHRMDCFGCNRECIHERPFCVLNVTSDAVWKEIVDMLENRSAAYRRES